MNMREGDDEARVTAREGVRSGRVTVRPTLGGSSASGSVACSARTERSDATVN